MTNELFQCMDELVAENKALTLKLQVAETEICRLKSALEDADNEVGRLGMVLRRQGKDMESIRRHGKQI